MMEQHIVPAAGASHTIECNYVYNEANHLHLVVIADVDLIAVANLCDSLSPLKVCRTFGNLFVIVS